MSSALVRQALELVDSENSVRDKKRKSSRRGQGDDRHRQYDKRKKSEPEQHRSESVVEKLLLLTKHKSDTRVTNKLVSRAISGKPATSTSKQVEEEKSVLFEDCD